MTPPPLYSRLMAAALFGVFAYAAWHSARQAWADELFTENTPESLARAVALAPGNAAYRELLGEHREGLGADPTSDFIAAARLSPRSARYWIRLSFFHEVQGKYAQAERELLEADRVDRKFDPPWALMNFYFRRNNAPEFWRWARRAFEISYDDVSALFRLCLDMDPDWHATQAVLPDRPDVAVKFLFYLTTEARALGAGPMAGKIAATAQPGDVPTLLAWCDFAMTQEMPAVLAVWNTLSERGLIPLKPLAPAEGRIVTNADFSSAPTEQAFDWRATPIDGIALLFPGDAEGLDATLSGAQPEDCVLLWQPIPLTPGREYTIEYRYKVSAENGAASVGVHWEVLPPGDGPPLARSEDLNAASAGSEWTTASFRLPAGANDGGRLRLRYTRPPGSVRWQGKVTIHQVTAAVASAKARP